MASDAALVEDIDQLPIIDFEAADDSRLGRQLDAAFTGIGFCYFRGIGVDESLREGVFAASRRFHAMPAAAKQADGRAAENDRLRCLRGPAGSPARRARPPPAPSHDVA